MSDVWTLEQPDDEDEGAVEPYEGSGSEGGDPVRAMHDTDEGQGDETGLHDLYAMDTREADERHVALDRVDDEEALLD